MSQIQCPKCKGTGYIRIGLRQVPCENCNTRGHINQRDDAPKELKSITTKP